MAAFLNGKDVLAVLPTGFGKSAIFQLFVHVKENTSKDSACILVICLLWSLMEERIAEAKSMGVTANSLPKASLGDVGAGKFQLLFSSVFLCALSVSLEFSVIFLLSKYTDCLNCRCTGIANAIWKILVTFDGNASLFQNFDDDNLFCWKAWIDFH